MASERPSLVRGPVAIMTVPSAGISVTSSGMTVIRGCWWIAWPIHSQRPACGNSGLVRHPHDQGTQQPHFCFQQADRVGQPVAAQTVGADQFRHSVQMMSRGFFPGLHFVQIDGNPPLRQLPCGFAPGQTAAQYCYAHSSSFSSFVTVSLYRQVSLAHKWMCSPRLPRFSTI